MLKFFKTLIILIIPLVSVHSQNENDFDFISSLTTNSDQTLSYVNSTKVNKDQNELQHSIRYLFLVYKNYFSSQDGNQCSFTPSCSDYCLATIRKNGIVKGGIQTLDRLTRCNSLSPEKYQIDFQKRKLIDRVE